MKLKDFLKVMKKEVEFIYLGISVHGMQFETKHSVGFYLDNGDELNDMEIMCVYIQDGEMHVRLKG